MNPGILGTRDKSAQFIYQSRSRAPVLSHEIPKAAQDSFDVELDELTGILDMCVGIGASTRELTP
jgi:hypothetical protein